MRDNVGPHSKILDEVWRGSRSEESIQEGVIHMPVVEKYSRGVSRIFSNRVLTLLGPKGPGKILHKLRPLTMTSQSRFRWV